MRPWAPRAAVGVVLAAALLAALPPTAPLAARGRRPHYSPGDLIRRLLAAQDSRYWTRAGVVKVERRLDARDRPRGRAQVTRGRLLCARGKARLRITAPAKGLVVADGRHLWVELPQVGQVYRYDQARLAAGGNFFLDLASSIRHYAALGKPRPARLGPGFNPDWDQALVLTPRRGAVADFRRLKVWVNVRRWVVLRVVLDRAGVRDDIDFPGVRAMSAAGLRADPGQRLRKDAFRYRPPRRYQVFDMDGL